MVGEGVVTARRVLTATVKAGVVWAVAVYIAHLRTERDFYRRGWVSTEEGWMADYLDNHNQQGED